MRDLLDIDINNENDNYKSCAFLKKFPLAYAYVPYQVFNETYSVSDSLSHGTVFPDLYKPVSVYGNEFIGEMGENRNG